MLEELNIHNYALIDRVNVKFKEGFNILTGETGAGKSILVGALGLLLGQKADPTIIRSGTEETLVSAVVRIQGNREAAEWLKEHGIIDDDGYIILRRMVKKSGRGSIYIGSVPVTRTELEEFSALLFDMHGQHDNQSLLQVPNHRKLLDRYAEIEGEVVQFTTAFMELSRLRERFSRLIGSEKEKARQMEMLSHAVNEIRAAGLLIGEEEQLEKEHSILANHERLFRLVEAVFQNTSENRSGALVFLRRAKDAMDEVVEIDSSLSGLCNQLQDSFFELEDFVESIRQYKNHVSFDPNKLTEIEQRLQIIHDLQKKYGDTIEDVLEYADKSEKELEEIENSENDKQVLREEITRLEQSIRQKAIILHERRENAARILERKVEEGLATLGMPKSRFKVQVEEKKNPDGKPIYSQYGKDSIEFLISSNQGEPFKPLKKIASGGEISRIMLSLKTILAKADNINALIFDEIDTGIGGEVAVSVGQRLKELSRVKQVLCITHLATIAARADNHIKVIKEVKDNRTLAVVESLKGESLKGEVSRMLSGDERNQVSLQHAEELLKKYGSL